MSFSEYKDLVELGDTLIVYISFNCLHAITVQPTIKNKKGQSIDHVLQTSYGALRVADLVGVRYGSQVRLTRGWAIVLHPSAELWTRTLPHRTQILYNADISLVLLQLDLAPGRVVCEAGTGSGSLSHAIARAIAPSGHLYTCDFHQQRALIAAEEFQRHGLQHVITATHRDVCGDGFGVTAVADAVFLDLPQPWLAVNSAISALKQRGGRLCSFSPCIEQTQRMCLTLGKAGFSQVTTMECVQREFQVRQCKMDRLSFDQESDSQDSQDNSNSKGNNGVVTDKCTVLTGVPLTRMAGHTGYLTFATFPPQPAR